MLQQWMASKTIQRQYSAYCRVLQQGQIEGHLTCSIPQVAAIDGATTAEAHAALEACRNKAVEIVTGNAAVQVGGSSSSSCGLCRRRRRCCYTYTASGVRSASISGCGVRAASYLL
jgi:hypothetical protein